MAAFRKFDQFVSDLARNKHLFSSHVLRVMLTNVAPIPTNAVKSELVEIAAVNGYLVGGKVVDFVRDGQTKGRYRLVLASPEEWIASGDVGPFRYAVLYNDTQAFPAKPLIGFWDYGESIKLSAGDKFQVELDETNGVLTLI